MNRRQPFAIRITTCARHQLSALNFADQRLLEGHLAQLAIYAAHYDRPAGEHFTRRGQKTSIIELRVWPFLILYEPCPAERAVTVMHVLRIPERTPLSAPHHPEP